jgi:hypothetical protein
VVVVVVVSVVVVVLVAVAVAAVFLFGHIASVRRKRKCSSPAYHANYARACIAISALWT